MIKVRTAVAALITVALPACGSARAEKPDSQNPAHCFAAFQYGRAIMLGHEKPEVYGAIVSTARAMYEMRQIKGSEAQRLGKSTGEALLSDYADQPDTLEQLLRDCYKKQDADPAFKALDRSGALMAAARKVDPICKEDAACVAGTKFSTWTPR